MMKIEIFFVVGFGLTIAWDLVFMCSFNNDNNNRFFFLVDLSILYSAPLNPVHCSYTNNFSRTNISVSCWQCDLILSLPLHHLTTNTLFEYKLIKLRAPSPKPSAICSNVIWLHFLQMAPFSVSTLDFQTAHIWPPNEVLLCESILQFSDFTFCKLFFVDKMLNFIISI